MSGQASQGTILEYDSTGSGSWVAIASVKDLDGPGNKIGSRDVTPLNPTGRAKAKLPTVLDGGQVKATLLFNSTEWNLIFSTLAFATKNWRILFTNGSYWAFSAFWTEANDKVGDAEADSELEVVFEVTGAPTFTP